MGSISQNKLQDDQKDKIQKERDACNYAIKLCSAPVLPMSLSTAIHLGLFKLISDAGDGAQFTAKELTFRLNATSPLAPSALERVLDVLASHNIFTCATTADGDGRTTRRYGATPVTKYFAPNNDDGVCLAPLALMTSDRVSMESWYYLKDAILHGGVAFNRAHDGLTEFEYHAIDPRFSKVFNEGMRSHSIVIMKNILGIYNGFEDIKVLVDVCGGTGGTLSMITGKHPQIKGINFDLPHVIAAAPPLPGVENVGGDVFASIPNGDALFLKWVLHDWNDEESIKILKNCYKAIPDNGKAIVVDSLRPETPDSTDLTHCVLHADVIMLLESPSGRERTEKEFRILAKESGFGRFSVLCNFSNAWVMELKK